jgi:phosphoglycerate dehydrogenase-like enzyme
VQAGRWRTERSPSEGLLDQSLGLVGFGMVAKHLVNMLTPFRVKISAYDPYVRDDALASLGVARASLEEVISVPKIVSLHAARTPDTYHMVTRELLHTVRDGALFVNTARGSIVDEEALADELALGRFKAVLDVYDDEPLPQGSRLRGMKNVLLMPHMAGPTVDRRRSVTLALIEDIENFFGGRPLVHEIAREYAMAMTR